MTRALKFAGYRRGPTRLARLEFADGKVALREVDGAPLSIHHRRWPPSTPLTYRLDLNLDDTVAYVDVELFYVGRAFGRKIYREHKPGAICSFGSVESGDLFAARALIPPPLRYVSRPWAGLRFNLIPDGVKDRGVKLISPTVFERYDRDDLVQMLAEVAADRERLA